MSGFLYFYQHLPLYLDPVFKIGFFSVSWYSVMYLVGFLVVYWLLKYRIKNKEIFNFQFSQPKTSLPLAEVFNKFAISNDQIIKLTESFLLYAFVGLLVGARLGEVFFYNFSYYWAHPIRIISPFDPITGEFIGIYGMSYHGGLVGVLIASFVFCQKHKVNFWKLSDFVVPAIPAGYFFGRVGNFINNELYGKITGKVWGMYFKDSPWQLRHPSQLYEAFLEGIILFIVLWSFRNKEMLRGKILAVYLIGYAIFRFICEYFREPEGSVNYLCFFTLGQSLSVIMIVLGLTIMIFQKRKKLV